MKIINNYSKEFPLNLEKIARKLLEAVPDEHMKGLDSIILLDEFPQKKYDDVLGLYWEKYGLESARIEISINNIYGDPYCFLKSSPLLSRYLFARALFHQIGFHYRHLIHGVSKRKKEKFAEEYRRKLLQKKFFWWFS